MFFKQSLIVNSSSGASSDLGDGGGSGAGDGGGGGAAEDTEMAQASPGLVSFPQAVPVYSKPEKKKKRKVPYWFKR